MFIKKIFKDSNDKLIVCDTTRNGGIFKEVEEKEVPMKNRVKLEELGGCGNVRGDYFRSNTAGATSKKYFKKVNGVIKFYPKKYYEEMKKIKDINIEDARKYLNEYSKNSKYIVFESYESVGSLRTSKTYQILSLRVRINENDLIPMENDYMEYSEVFRNCFKYGVSVKILLEKSEEPIKKIKEMFNSDSANMEKIITSEEVNSYIDKLKKLNENGRLVFSEIQI